uniref:EGF-like domain-containing protein n=1 Tax=Globodera pallida TaxID=36090 RepID=A0A183CIP0_GLOPA
MILLTFWLLLIALKACGVHGDEPPDEIWNMCENDLVTLDKKCQTRLICYQSKLAKDSGNWKVGALTSDNQSVEADFWKSIRFGAFMRDFNGMTFQIAALEIRQFIGKKDMKLCKTKCEAKWEPQTEAPKDSSTMKISRTEPSTSTTTPPEMPKAQHMNHLGINCVQIEFPMEIPNFSLNISTSSYWIACAVHQRDDKADHVQDNNTKIAEVANKDHFNACSKVPTSSVCNKSLELYACYKSIKNQTHINKEIAEICQKHLNQSFRLFAGFRLRICMQREAEKQMLAFETSLDFSFSEKMIKTTKKFPIKFGEVSELMEFVPFSFFEFGHQPSEIHTEYATGTVLDSIFNEQINGSWTKTLHFVPPLNENMEIYFQISKPGFTKLITRQANLLSYQDNPNKKDLKPFRRPSWDSMAFPSTEIPPNDKRTDDPLEDGDDVLYTKEQAQHKYDNLVKACAKCRNSSKLEKESSQRQKRQYLIETIQWEKEKFPIPIRFDLKSFGKEIEFAKAAIKGAVTWIMENTCVNFTFDKSNTTHGIQITDDGNGSDYCDLTIINRMYCNDSCGAENLCQNGGYPNPRQCSECFCPDGYGGKQCETLEEDSDCTSLGAHSTRELEADWQTRTFNPSINCVIDYECACHWRIKPKDGKKLRIQLKQLDLRPQCSARPCHRPFFEINFRKDKRAQGARLCCPDAIRQMSPSQNWIEAEEPGTEIIISAHLNGMNNVTIELTYETDGAKIVRSDECPDPRDLFIKERNPGQHVTCNADANVTSKSKQIPCSRSNESYVCHGANYTAQVNGRPTNKTQIFMECLKREDNPTKFWGYWEDKAQDPIHIDDIQCVQHHIMP